MEKEYCNTITLAPHIGTSHQPFLKIIFSSRIESKLQVPPEGRREVDVQVSP